MNKDIRLATSFKGHRKRKKLKRLLGFGAEVYLIDLWLSVAMACPEGVLIGWYNQDIADACDWDGDPEQLVSAFIESGWIDIGEDGTYILHDWDEHQGWACHAKTRSRSAKKAADIRWNKKHTPTGKPSDSDSNATALLSHQVRNAPSPSPSPSPSPNKEDVINITSLSSCGGDPSENPSESKLNNSSEIKEIFQYWKNTLNHPKARIDEKRKIKISSALKNGYSVDDIKLAVDGCLASPYHQGENQQSAIYDSLELICRDSEHIDRFIKLSNEPNAKLLSAKGRQARQNGQTWLQMRQQKREAQNG